MPLVKRTNSTPFSHRVIALARQRLLTDSLQRQFVELCKTRCTINLKPFTNNTFEPRLVTPNSAACTQSVIEIKIKKMLKRRA